MQFFLNVSPYFRCLTDPIDGRRTEKDNHAVANGNYK
jgi:hypothetical protein